MIYVSADEHLCRLVWRSRKDLEGDSFVALKAFGTAVIEDDVPAGEGKMVLLAGDIFDAKKVDGPTLEAFCDFVDELYKHNIPVYFVQGNHEFNEKSPIAETCGAISLQDNPITFDDRVIKGLDFLHREKLLEALKTIGACDILVLHCAMEHLVGYVGACDLKLEEIPQDVQNVVVGDIHVTHRQRIPGRGYCISPGPLHPCNITQGGPKGFFKLPKGSGEWEFCEIHSRAILRLEVESELDWNNAKAAIAAISDPKGTKPIVDIKYAAEISELVEEWLSANAGKTAVVFDSMIPEKVELDIPEEAQKQDLTLEKVMPYVITADPVALEIAQALAGSPDDAERIVENKLRELLKDDNTEKVDAA
jgi:DNA repair exonuclease SbcCD nuclease subunit